MIINIVEAGEEVVSSIFRERINIGINHFA